MNFLFAEDSVCKIL